MPGLHLEQQGLELHSFRGFYALMYRHHGVFAHASAHSLTAVAEDLPSGRTRVALEVSDEPDPLPLINALFSYSLYIANARLGWPRAEAIEAVWTPR